MIYIAVLTSIFFPANNFVFLGRYIRRPLIYLLLSIAVNLVVTLSTYFLVFSAIGIDAVAETEGVKPEVLYLKLKLSITILLPITLSGLIAWLMRKKASDE